MPTQTVVLTEHQEKVIDGLVKSGRYENASEVMREGLRLIEQRENLEAAKLAALQQASQQGFSDLEQGRFVDVPVDGLDDFVRSLGQEAEANLQKSGI